MPSFDQLDLTALSSAYRRSSFFTDTYLYYNTTSNSVTEYKNYFLNTEWTYQFTDWAHQQPYWSEKSNTDKAAKRRARKILKEFCTPEQWKQFLKQKTITVIGSHSGIVYTVILGRIHNVKVSSEESKYTLCAHPQIMVPDEDTILAQKLMLECNEQEFLKIANRQAA